MLRNQFFAIFISLSILFILTIGGIGCSCEDDDDDDDSSDDDVTDDDDDDDAADDDDDDDTLDDDDAVDDDDDDISDDDDDTTQPDNCWLDSDGDGFGDPDQGIYSAGGCPNGYVTNSDDCDDGDQYHRPPSSTADPGFVTDHCGQGDVLVAVTGAPGSFGYFTDGIGSSFTASPVAHTCAGTGDTNAMQMDFNLVSSPGNNPYVVARFEFTPRSLESYDYLLFTFKTDNPATLPKMEVKLDTPTTAPYMHQFSPAEWGNLLTLIYFRTIFIPLEKFTNQGMSLSSVDAFEIGLTDPDGGYTGSFFLDDVSVISAADLRAPFVQSYFECPPKSAATETMMSNIANLFKGRIDINHSFIQTWFDEFPPLYHIFGVDLALIVLSFEYARTGDSNFETAATQVADAIVALQNPNGTWWDFYEDNGGTLVKGTNAGTWIGNIGWTNIALKVFVDNVNPASATTYENAMDNAAGWIIQEQTAYGGPAGGVTEGAEGNISAYFGLKSAGGYNTEADNIADFLINNVWDTGQGRFNMGYQNSWLAIDVVGNWGAQFLRQRGLTTDALNALALAAGIFPVESWNPYLQFMGMGDIAGPFQPMVEFTGQYTAAGGIGSHYLYNQFLIMEDVSGNYGPGSFMDAPDDFWFGIGWNPAWEGVPPSAWVYITLHGGFLHKI